MSEGYMTRGEDYSKAKVSAYPLNRAKAIRILKGGMPLDVLKGPKTRSFYRNMVDPLDREAVTIDFHAMAITRGRVLKAKDREASFGLREYNRIAECYREVGRKEQLLPNQVQAITWVTWKRMHKIVSDPQMKLFGYVMV
jgi:hypothetical protein